MSGPDERFEWEIVQDHYGQRARRGQLVLRNLRRPSRRARPYRREMRRTGVLMAGLVGAMVLGLWLLLAAI